MIEAARRFIRRVLLLHLLLLLVVLGVVVIAALEVYQGARDHAISQARQRQEMLARQTAAGIETFYSSILSNLELRRSTTEESADTADNTPADTRPADTRPAEFRPGEFRPGEPRPGAAPLFGGRLAASPPDPNEPRPQSAPRVGRAGGRFSGEAPDSADARPPQPAIGQRRTGRAGFGGSFLTTLLVARQLQGRSAVTFTYDRLRDRHAVVPADELRLPSEEERVAADRIVEVAHDWLKGVTRGSIGPFLRFQDAKGKEITGHLIAAPATPNSLAGPLGTPAESVTATFIPLDAIRALFFDPLNGEKDHLRATLVDEEGTAMMAVDEALVGRNIRKDYRNPEVQSIYERFIASAEPGSYVFERPSRFADDITLPPRIVAFGPITTLPGLHWTVMISAPLSDTEDLVAATFQRLLIWAIFVGLSVTGIMVSTSVQLIRSRVTLERARHEMLTRELNQAREIQLAWLPDVSKAPPGVDIAAVNLPAFHISGDFYNWFTLPDGRIVIAIGDVTGHGMSAAFLMSTTQLLVRTTMNRIHDPGRCLEEVNRQLCTQAFRGQFVTMLLMVLNPAEGTIEIASAGHPAPLLGQNGRFEPAQVESQLVLGVDCHEHYFTQAFVLHPNAALLLYTDGVIEAESPDGRQYSTRHLLASLATPFESVQDLVSKIVANVKAHCGGGELGDDLTLVAVQLQPEPATPASAPGALPSRDTL